MATSAVSPGLLNIFRHAISTWIALNAEKVSRLSLVYSASVVVFSGVYSLFWACLIPGLICRRAVSRAQHLFCSQMWIGLAAGKRQLTCQTLLTAIELIKQRLCKGEKSDWGKWGCWPGAGNITLVCVSKCRTYAYHGTGKYDRRKLYCMGILCGQTDARRSIQHSDVFCDSVLQRNMSKSLMWQFLVPLRLHSPSLRVTLAILWAGLPRIGAFPFLPLKTG